MSFPGQESVSSAIAYVERLLSDLGFSGTQLAPSVVLSILLAPGAMMYLGRRGMPQTSRRPPIVSHWIPWVGSALQVMKDPDALYTKSRQELGPVFGVRAFGSTMYHVADTDLIMAIYRQPHAFSMNPAQVMFLHAVFGASVEACKQPDAIPEMIESMHRQLSPNQFPPLLSSFIAHARTQIQSLPLKTPISLLSVAMQTIQNADCAMLFGTAFLDNYYDQARRTAFAKFDQNVPLLAINFPASLMSDTIAARQTLLNSLGAYYEGGIPGDASELIKEAAQLAQNFGWTTSDQAAFGLSLMWPLLGNAPYAAYWLLAFHLSRPEGLAPLVREIDSALSSDRDMVEIARDSSLTPYLNACIDETIRLASDSYSVRWVPEGKEDEYRLGEYVFKPGDQIACNMRGVHMDERVYARPEVFEPERFLDGGKERLRGKFIPFGGGFSMCSGRHLAMTQIKAYIMVLLSQFELELASGEGLPGFSPNNRGFGMIRPVGDIMVRLTKRKPPIMQTTLVDSPVEEKSLRTSQLF